MSSLTLSLNLYEQDYLHGIHEIRLQNQSLRHFCNSHLVHHPSFSLLAKQQIGVLIHLLGTLYDNVLLLHQSLTHCLNKH